MGRNRRGATGRSSSVAAVAASVAVLALALLGGARGASATEAEADRDLPPDGSASLDAESLYGRDCVSCHGPGGAGSWRGPALVDTGEASAYYMLATGRMPIEHPERAVRRQEPAYADEEIDALVDYVAGFGPGGLDLPDVDPAAGDAANGGDLYRRHCSGCHGITGVGGSLAFDVVAPPVLPASPTVVGAAVVHGPGSMPSFDERLTDDELDDVVAYVQVLRDPIDAGGHPVARAGRVDEAVVGWGAGLGGLLLFAAWLARRPR